MGCGRGAARGSRDRVQRRPRGVKAASQPAQVNALRNASRSASGHRATMSKPTRGSYQRSTAPASSSSAMVGSAGMRPSNQPRRWMARVVDRSGDAIRLRAWARPATRARSLSKAGTASPSSDTGSSISQGPAPAMSASGVSRNSGVASTGCRAASLAIAPSSGRCSSSWPQAAASTSAWQCMPLRWDRRANAAMSLTRVCSISRSKLWRS